MEVEQEEEKKEVVGRKLTEAEKREWFNSKVLEKFIKGKNRLAYRIEKPVNIEISADDRQNLLNRLMRLSAESTRWLLSDIVIAREAHELEWPDIHIFMKADKKPVKVKVLFKHFLAPSKEDGGWMGAGANHPCQKAWKPFYDKYELYIGANSRNGNAIKAAHELNYPLDIAITTTVGKLRTHAEDGTLKIVVREQLLRFVIFEPCPDSRKGEDIFLPV